MVEKFTDFNILGINQYFAATLTAVVFFSILYDASICSFFMKLFFLIQGVTLYRPALGNEMDEWNHGLSFRRPAFVYNNKKPVNLSFLSFRILARH